MKFPGVTILTFFLLFALKIAAQEDNTPSIIVFGGIVLDADSSQPLPGSNVIVNGKRGTSTDAEGSFAIQVRPSDSVLISQLGFTHYLFIMPGDFTEKEFNVTIRMTRDTVLLNEVQVYPWPSREQFKKEFMELAVDDEEKIELNLQPVKEDKSVSKAGASAISMSSMFKYKRFYKDENDKRQVQAMSANQKYKEYVLARFNQAAKKFTPLKEEAELDEFRVFCNLTEEFIETATDYDMAAMIVKRYRDFTAKN